MKLDHKIAIVTGAGRGIGAAIALAFAREGATLALWSRTIQETNKIAATTRLSGRPTVTYCVDVSDYEQVHNMVVDVAARFHRIDILVNNAGVYGPIGLLWKNDPKKWVSAVAANLFGTLYCTISVLPYMIDKRRGKIINLAGGGEGAFPRFSAYASSKSAIAKLTETLSEELKEYNIDVNSIAPGPVNTRFLDEVLAAGTDAGPFYERAKKQKASGGVSPEKAAELAVFLASDASNKLTGRLLSAVWDDWQNIDISRLSDSALYQTRRIDGRHFVEIK